MATSDAYEFDSWTKDAPASFRAGSFRVTRIKTLRMSLWHRKYSPVTDTVYLFGQKTAQDLESPQVFLHAYELPAAKDEYLKERRFYERQKRTFKLAGGDKFDPSLLAIPQVASDFRHEAFQTRDGKSRRRIVHLYEATDRAAIVVFSLNSAGFTSNAFFHKLTGRMTIQ